MPTLALLLPTGRLTRAPFAVAIVVVYALSFLSQVLLSPPVIARAGPWPFAVLQAALTWAWFTLHAQRLRDAGHGRGMAVGIAIVYGLAIALLVLIVTATTPGAAPATTPAAPAGKEAPTLLSFFLVFYLLAILTNDPSLGLLGYVLIVVTVLLLAPVIIAFGFTIWTASRPSLPPPP